MREATILVVDDDPVVLNLLRLILERCGFRIRTAANGQEAIAKFSSAPGEIDLVLSDVLMPGVNGVELARHLKSVNADLPVLLMSAFCPISPDLSFAFIAKPFGSASELVEKIQSMLASQKPKSYPDKKSTACAQFPSGRANCA